MGYVDEKGIWKDTARHQVIEGVKAWSRAGDEDTALLQPTDPAKMIRASSNADSGSRRRRLAHAPFYF
jgi:hypothetical protein